MCFATIEFDRHNNTGGWHLTRWRRYRQRGPPPKTTWQLMLRQQKQTCLVYPSRICLLVDLALGEVEALQAAGPFL